MELTPSIQANGTPIDFVSDLGAREQQPSLSGTLVFKPSFQAERKHRLVDKSTGSARRSKSSKFTANASKPNASA
jgi:hypothetical protein